jgi:hypothetical protein
MTRKRLKRRTTDQNTRIAYKVKSQNLNCETDPNGFLTVSSYPNGGLNTEEHAAFVRWKRSIRTDEEKKYPDNR